MVGHLFAAVALVLLAAVALGGFDEAALRSAVRWVGACSLTLFLSAYTAGPLERIVRSPLTGWQRANRRYLGVSFALAHLLHALALVALATRSATSFSSELGAPLVGVLLLGYVFVLTMLVTSFDETAAWLGPRLWRALHTAGLHYVWLLFLVAYLRPLRSSLWYAIPVGLLLGALLLRVRAAKLSPRRR
jgi:hypothetical protein